MYKRAKHIVQKLKDNGYIAYYAGGWVRDFILNEASDDIDIATNALPETIQSLFEHTVPIGLSFGIILVIIDSHQYEIATFRKDVAYADGRRPTSIEFTTALEDASRRDFTINGMFYDPLKEEIIDYVNGQEDLKKKIIRAIGNPHERIKEDRLRMLRAVRIAARFDFDIEEHTQKAIIAHSKELFPFVAIERIWQEIIKMSKYANFKKGLIILFDFQILQTIFPSLKHLDKKTLEKNISHVDYFPKKTPTIAKILDLFPKSCLDEQISLCKYLKLSNEDISFVKIYKEIKTFVAPQIKTIINKLPPPLKEIATHHMWAHAYSNNFSSIILEIIASHLNTKEQQTIFLQDHKNRINLLSNFIERIKNNNPILKAYHLEKEGIKPTPLMGKLLKEAEKIAINEKVEDTAQIIKKLKKTALWPKK